MKVLDTSFESPTSSQPLKQGSLNLLQQAWQESVISIVQYIISINGTYNPAKVYILYGCVNSGSGLNFIISAGAAFYNNEVFQVPAVTFTAAGGQTAVATVTTTFITAANADPVVFTDGIAHNVHQNRIISIASGVSGSGTSDFSAFLPLYKYVAPTPAFNTFDSTTPTVISGSMTSGGISIASRQFPELGIAVIDLYIQFNASSASWEVTTPLHVPATNTCYSTMMSTNSTFSGNITNFSPVLMQTLSSTGLLHLKSLVSFSGASYSGYGQLTYKTT